MTYKLTTLFCINILNLQLRLTASLEPVVEQQNHDIFLTSQHDLSSNSDGSTQWFNSFHINSDTARQLAKFGKILTKPKTNFHTYLQSRPVSVPRGTIYNVGNLGHQDLVSRRLPCFDDILSSDRRTALPTF